VVGDFAGSNRRRSDWFIAYLAGLLIVAGRFLAGTVRTVRMVRAARPATYAQALADRLCRDLAISRPVRALESNGAAVPMTWGTLRPVVMLPEAAAWWRLRLHAVVLHELSTCSGTTFLPRLPPRPHAASTGSIQWSGWQCGSSARSAKRPATTPYFPAAAAPDYAGHLLELARGLVQRRSLADAPAMAENGDLEQRVRAVLDRGRNRAPLSRRLAAAVAALACVLVAGGSGDIARAGRKRRARGVVQDPSGARVPNCEVRIRNLDHKNEEVGNVNAAGEFGFANVPAGRYAIEVRARGFAPGKTESLVEAGRQNAVMVHSTSGRFPKR
jgi:hypothetical protein